MRIALCRATDGAEPPASSSPEPLVEAGHEVCLVDADDLEALEALHDDDWLHLDVAVDGDGAADFLRGLSAVVAPLSMSFWGVGRAPDWHLGWEAVEAGLELCGASAGIVLAQASTLAWVTSAPDDGEPVAWADDDLDEVAAGWASLYGLAMVVLVDGAGARAVKPDGRVTRVVAAGGGRLGLSSAFLADYLDDPSDLERATARLVHVSS